jgi:hypothetical protein
MDHAKVTADSVSVAGTPHQPVMAQEFWTSQWVMSTTDVGSLAGGWVGGLASGAVLKNPFWGAIVGSGSGGWLLIRPVEFLRGIFDVVILEVGDDALGGLLQCDHEVVGCLT